MSPPPDSNIDVIILNGAECEPYLTADHRLMVEMPDDVVFGIRAVMRALDVHKGYIGIEVNKPDAIEAVTKAAEPYPEVEVVGLEIKYPQGAEKQLIYACTGGREVPSGALPAAAGAVVYKCWYSGSNSKINKNRFTFNRKNNYYYRRCNKRS